MHKYLFYSLYNQILSFIRCKIKPLPIMDETSQNLDDFEALLKSYSTNKPLALYATSEHKNSYVNTSKTSKIGVKEVLANVSRQVKAMQNADTMGCKRVGITLDKYKKREFLPINRIPVYKEDPQKLPTKFETQCVTDTQLIDVVENAEIVDKHSGITQEFNKTFCHKSDDDNDDKPDENSSKSNITIDTDRNERKLSTNNDKSDVITENYNLNSQDSKMFENSDPITCEMDTVTYCQNDDQSHINVVTSQETQGFNKSVEMFDITDAERSASPVLNTAKRIATPPLVVDLYTFEKFEDLALPIIEEYEDLKVAKNMINSQIIGREISILNNFNENIGRDSPVISKIECITTNINKDDMERICTCSSKCVAKDVQPTNETISDDVILISGNKKRESIIKAEIKDEILFSSDEEYEYLHKNVQELPLTCALETSFYDTSDVLDKTMYVGFQTASNKSIQINTVSFTKAKSLLSDIDNEGSGKSLSDLVEIFDSGKAVSRNEEVMLMSNMPAHDIANQTSNKLDRNENNDLTAQSNTTSDVEKPEEDTFQNVSLTALEQDVGIKDDIVMSQVIQFKSISRTAKLNNSIMSDKNVRDTEYLKALEPNKDIDDDVIMSQVIPFKSIPRTANIDNACTSNISQESLLSNKAIVKRKFEGFKTASNKKIKLSDKALARCKKVFQDIDLEDPEDTSCKSNNVETEADFLRDLKSHDFDISDDGLKINYDCDIEPISINATNLQENVSDIINLETTSKVNDRDFKSSLRVIEEQPRIVDVDLQINDKNILQEFEYNEMPFEETNNNVLAGFKTASNKNIVISEGAMAATKNVFQDIVTIATADNPNTTMKKQEYSIEDCDKDEHVFKQPLMDFRKLTARQTTSPIDTLEKQKTYSIMNKKNDDCETYDVQNKQINGFIRFKTASNKDLFISEQAKERTKGFYKEIDEDVLKKSVNNAKFNSSNEEKHTNHLEDDFNCGIDTQAFLAEELTSIEDLLKDKILENQKPNSPVFEGFQTASRKPIVISERALENSKKLLEDITSIDIKSSSIENKVDDKRDTEEGKDNNVGKINKVADKLNSITNETQGFTGFITANNKKVAVSNKAVEASKTLFQDIVLSQQANIVRIEETEEVSNSEIAKNQMERKSDSKTIQRTEISLGKDQKATGGSSDILTEPPTFVGFQTASAKPIRISASAMEKTKKLLSEFELKDHEICDKVVGFQTVSNEKVTISAECLAKSKQMLKNPDLRDNLNNDNDGYAINDKNASDIFIDHTKAKNLQQGNDDSSKESTSKFIGFQTASNKKVNVSEEALAKCKQIFQDVDLFNNESDVYDEEYSGHEDNRNPVFKGFQTANNERVIISEKALENSKKLFHDISDSTKTNEDAPVFKGFQTSSNKKVQISKIALEKSKRLFEDLNLSQLGKDAKTTVDTCENNSAGLQAVCKRNEVSNQALAKTKEFFKDDLEKENESLTHNTRTSPVFKGFQTASNKKVKISEVALAKSKRLFEDMNLSQLDREAKMIVQEDHFEGFKTANNKIVEVSAQALVQTKDMFRDTTANSTPAFKGFQTASNKKVAISENALAKSKKLFEDLNLSQLNKDSKTAALDDSFRGFQTANNKAFSVSADTLAKTKDIIVNLEKGDYDDSTEIERHKDTPIFQGFQTASNKKVAISEKALAKCKEMFEDINFSQFDKELTATVDPYEVQSDLVKHKNEPVNSHKNDIRNIQTPDKKRVKISEQALEKSKHICKGIQLHNEDYNVIRTPETKTYHSPTKLNIANDVIDTQVFNDFQETLNTEDFCKNTPTSKRSGSPIISCPRAKKRKFETPYRTSKKAEPKMPFVPPKLAKTYNFNDNYKKDKKYALKDIDNLEKEHTKIIIDSYISEFNFDNLLNFEFKDKRNDYTTEKLTTEDLKKIFLGSVNKKIVPDGWLDNHIKLIIWKLLSYEIKYPITMKKTCTVKNVLEQLKYRYDRELYHVQRPILRKILEKDEVASKTMVLCVAGIYVDNVSVTSVNPSSQNVELLLTDGWYCVKACLDRMLIRLVTTGAIVVGTKLAVCGAELMNCEQGIAPWEDTSSVRLKLHGNSVRRARWHARLGVCIDLIQCPLGAARSDGGKMSATRVVVTRVYPPLYVEKMDDGSTVTLSERLEQVRQMKYESQRQAAMERLYEEVEKEMSDQESQDSEGYSNEKGCTDSGSQISRNMKKSKDPDEYRSHLTKSQNRLLEDHSARQRERLIERVRGKFQEKLDKSGLKDRNVIPLLKVRVAGLSEKDGKIEVTKGYLSIWKPSGAVLELVTEDCWIEILNVIPTGSRNSEIQLSAGRQTVFNPYKHTNDKFKLYTNTLQRKCYEIKEITRNPNMTADNNEIDTVGMVFCIEPSTKDFKEQSFQNAYLADAEKNMICVNFWGGLKKFGFENVLDTGQIITCVNLQKRAGNTRKSITQYRVTELSYFTKTPKNKQALEITNALTSQLSKVKDKFCEDCLVLKNNYSIFKTRNENISPYRLDYNVSTNMVSPLRNCDNLNLTGLDFESSFNSQEISPQLLLRKKKVNEKIEKIRFVYGEPPPLSSIHIINKSKNASATYKSPLISNLERSKAGSPLQNVASPVTVNRTFVKNVNPVKLNFSRENLDESVDHFAEDFDASPPLSLDSDILN